VTGGMAGGVTGGVTGRLPDPAFWSGRRVFLTGHTGFKGSWLAMWLQSLGAEVTGFALAPVTPSLSDAAGVEGRITSIRGDIRDLPTLQAAMRRADPEVVLHMAAQALVRRSYDNPLETLTTNILGTAHVLEAARQVPGLRALVNVTTDKCYENREWAWAYRETDALGGHDPYSASKACAELVTAAWRRSFLSGRPGQPPVALATARAGNVIGGGDWAPDRLVPDCIRAFTEGRAVELRNPHATRPWQHVLDPLCGYLLLAEALHDRGQAFAEAWNFGPDTGDAQPVAAIVSGLAQAWGGGAVWRAMPGDHPHEAGLLAVDSARARTKLGWRPRVPLDTALDWTGAWYRQHHEGRNAHVLMQDDIRHYQAPSPADRALSLS